MLGRQGSSIHSSNDSTFKGSQRWLEVSLMIVFLELYAALPHFELPHIELPHYVKL